MVETLPNGGAGFLVMAQAWLHLAHQAEKNSKTVLDYQFSELRHSNWPTATTNSAQGR